MDYLVQSLKSRSSSARFFSFLRRFRETPRFELNRSRPFRTPRARSRLLFPPRFRTHETGTARRRPVAGFSERRSERRARPTRRKGEDLTSVSLLPSPDVKHRGPSPSLAPLAFAAVSSDLLAEDVGARPSRPRNEKDRGPRGGERRRKERGSALHLSLVAPKKVKGASKTRRCLSLAPRFLSSSPPENGATRQKDPRELFRGRFDR